MKSGGQPAIVYVDGGSRGNPGDAAFGVVVRDREGATLAEFGDYIGKATNNQAEYRGLLAALEWARRRGVQDLLVRADSELVVRQMTGRYRVKSTALQPLFHEARRLAAGFERFRIEHVRRDDNADADRLANLAMDLRGPVEGGAEP